MSDDTDQFVKETVAATGISVAWVYWRMAIGKGGLSAFIAGATVFITSLTTAQGQELAWDQWIIIIVGVLIAISKDILSFLSTTMTQLQHERSLDIPTDRTVVVSQPDAGSQTVTVKTDTTKE